MLRRGYAEALGEGGQNKERRTSPEDKDVDKNTAQDDSLSRPLFRKRPHMEKSAKPRAINPARVSKQPPGATRWAKRELAKDASFGIVTTSHPLTTTINELVKEIPPMPQDDAPDNTVGPTNLVLLVTPGLARLALDSTVPSTVLVRLENRLPRATKYITTTAIVDRLPTTPDQIEGAEGMAYMLLRNALPTKAEDQIPFQVSAQKPGSLTFQTSRVAKQQKDKQFEIQDFLQLPLSQTVFTTGLVSTMFLRMYTTGDKDARLELTGEKKLESQTLRLPALPTLHSRESIYAPLIPLTPFRKINYVMGNIIRKLSAQPTWELQSKEEGKLEVIENSRDAEQNVPASQDLEKAVSKYFEELDLQPETVSVWAFVIPKTGEFRVLDKAQKSPGIQAILGIDEGAIPAAWEPQAEPMQDITKCLLQLFRTVFRGARLTKVLSGGGGWGKKAGLLSLDPDVQYSTRELRQDAGWQFDFDVPDDGTGADVEKQKNQALGQIVKEGESIMFLLAPKLQNMPTSLAETERPRKRYSGIAPELTLSFGAIPSSIDNIARNPESDAASATIQHYPNLFGMLSEGGMAIRSQTRERKEVQSKFDVPFGRITYQQFLDFEGNKLQYYPNAIRNAASGGAGQSVEPSTTKAGANTRGEFREKARTEQDM